MQLQPCYRITRVSIYLQLILNNVETTGTKLLFEIYSAQHLEIFDLYGTTHLKEHCVVTHISQSSFVAGCRYTLRLWQCNTCFINIMKSFSTLLKNSSLIFWLKFLGHRGITCSSDYFIKGLGKRYYSRHN